MKLLVIGDCEINHISKYHEAFRRGLVRLFNSALYGKGYPNYNPALKTYREILDHIYPDGSQPDLLLAGYDLGTSLDKLKFEYSGMEDIHCPKAIILSDWWKITDNFKDAYPSWIEKYGITYVLCQHQAPFKIYANTSIADRLIHFPAAVDPELLNDFQQPKTYDVGFLGCGISPFDPFYPEREAIHKALLTRPDLNYLWKPHPGYNPLPQDHPLVGKNFGMLINQCKMFVVTGSRLRNTFGKYFEVPACHTLMLATHADGADDMGLIDGVHYVKVTPENILQKIDYYRAHPHEAAKITEAGYRLCITRHSIYARATQFYDLARKAARPSLDAIDIADDYEAGRFQKLATTAEKVLAASSDPAHESYAHYLRAQCYAHLGDVNTSAAASKAELASYTTAPEDITSVLPFASETELMSWFHLPGSFLRHLPIVYAIAVASKAQRILDLGIGFTTRALRTAALRTGGTVFSCDYAKDRFAHYLPHQTVNWKLALESSETFLQRLDAPLDFAIHDGAHDYKQVKRDLELLIPKMRRFAMIALHDTQQSELNSEMLAAIHDAVVNFKVSLTTLPFSCGLTLIRVEESNYAAATIPGSDFTRDGKTRQNAPLPHALIWPGELRPTKPFSPPKNTPLKLHLGCGFDHREGYINIDHSPASNADLVSSYMNLSQHFAPNSVQEILSMHAVNYVPLWEARDLFNTCRSLLAPGGKLIIETVNIESAARKLLDNTGNFSEYLEGLRGLNGFGLDHLARKEKYPPNMLGWGAWHLAKELTDAGFSQVATLPPTSHCAWRDMRVEATK